MYINPGIDLVLDRYFVLLCAFFGDFGACSCCVVNCHEKSE